MPMPALRQDSASPHAAVLAQLDERAGAPVLNPTLYNRLVAQFGSVLIAKQGEPMFGGGMEFDGRRTSYKPLSSGEYYRICCPFCLQRGAVDTRHRLWINHRWGVGLDPDMPHYDPQDKFWHMAVCYNERCLDNPANRKELRNMTYGALGRDVRKQPITIGKGRIKPVSLGIVDYPGRCQRVDQLPIDHFAYQYLLGRGVDPQHVGPMYDVSYCHESPMHPVVTAKIVIPIYMNGTMVGWQARPPYDIDWKAAKQPKYYNCPGTNKSLMLYGIEQTRTMPFCIIVEGVADVWELGAGAISPFGRTLSMQQAALINQLWKTVILALDGDAAKQTEEMHRILSRDVDTRIATVRMPLGLDPATIDRDYFWDLVYESCTQKGIDLLQ